MTTPTTTSTPTAKTSELRELLQRIRDDPDAGAWGEWARKLMEGDQRRKVKAIGKAKASTPSREGIKR